MDHNGRTNVYAYNAESYNGNMEHQYLRARYYDTDTADFITEEKELVKIMCDKDALLTQFYGLSSLAHIATSIKDSLVEILGKAFDYAHAKVAAAYDILLGFDFALIDNVIFNQQRLYWKWAVAGILMTVISFARKWKTG